MHKACSFTVTEKYKVVTSNKSIFKKYEKLEMHR